MKANQDLISIAPLTTDSRSESADLAVIVNLGKIRQQIGGPGTRPLDDQMAKMVQFGHLHLAEAEQCLRHGIFVDLIGKGVAYD